MVKMKLEDRPKYGMILQETCSNGQWTDHIYGNSIVEVRKALYSRARNVKWHKTASDPIGTANIYGMIDYYHTGNKAWRPKKELAYLTYDKKHDLLWWDPRDKSGKKKLVNSDGTLGLTWRQYYDRLAKLRR